VKLAEESNALSESGGRPCLLSSVFADFILILPYLIRSARVRGRRGSRASLWISASDTDAELGG